MGKVLWPLCRRGHVQNHSNVRFDYSRSYVNRRCKFCCSIIAKESAARKKIKMEWINQGYQYNSARRTATDNGSINPKTVVRSVLDASLVQ